MDESVCHMGRGLVQQGASLVQQLMAHLLQTHSASSHMNSTCLSCTLSQHLSWYQTLIDEGTSV